MNTQDTTSRGGNAQNENGKNKNTDDIHDVNNLLSTVNELIREGNFTVAEEKLVELIDCIEKGNYIKENELVEFCSFDNILQETMARARENITKSVVAINENISLVYFTYGWLLFERKEYLKARQNYEKAVLWNPASGESYLELAETYKQYRDFETFANLTRKAFKFSYKKSHIARCYRNMAFYYIEWRNREAAAGCLIMARQFFPESMELLAEERQFGIVFGSPVPFMNPQQVNGILLNNGIPYWGHSGLIQLLINSGDNSMATQDFHNAALYYCSAINLTNSRDLAVKLRNLGVDVSDKVLFEKYLEETEQVNLNQQVFKKAFNIHEIYHGHILYAAKNIADNSYYAAAGVSTASTGNFANGNGNTGNSQKDKSIILEKTIGKDVMSIMAAALIFIGMIYLAFVIYPEFGDYGKMIIMFTISGFFLLVGVIMVWKNPKNIVSLAVAAVGFGGTYISFFVSNICFDTIGDIPLYIILLIWSVCVCIFSKLKSWMFNIVGYMGVGLAAIGGCMALIGDGEPEKYVLLTLFFLIGTNVFYLVNFKIEFEKNILHYICYPIIGGFLCLFASEATQDRLELIFIGLILLLGATLNLIFSFFLNKTQKKDKETFGIVNGLEFLLVFMCLNQIIKNHTISAITEIAVFLALLVILQWKSREKAGGGEIFMELTIIISLSIGLFEVPIYGDYVNVLILSIPFIIYGFMAKKDQFKIYGLMTLFFYLLGFNKAAYDFDDRLIAVVGIFSVVIVCFVYMAFLLTKKEQYKTEHKMMLEIVFVAGILVAWKNYEYMFFLLIRPSSSLFFIMAAVSLILTAKPFWIHPVTKQKEMTMINTSNVFLAGMMFWSVWELLGRDYTKSLIYDICLIIVSVILFNRNSISLLKKKNQSSPGIYVGIKSTILLLAILIFFDAYSYIISISTLTMAVLFVLGGAFARCRSIRIYGLVLTMLSLCKFILLDLSYSGSIERAVSFIICGLLCFGISLIYSVVDKMLTNNDKENQGQSL